MAFIDPKQVDKADSALTKLENLLKRHWRVLVLIAFLYFAYWFCGLVNQEIQADVQHEVNSEKVDTVKK
jgi:hypothetical protein